MELYKAIQNRYSVRQYQTQPVEREKLCRVLDAGRIAPSARNLQNWKFIVITDADMIQKIGESAEQKWMERVPAIVAVVCTEPRMMSCKIPAGPVDCSIAIDHMTLAAVAEGLGTCWIGKFDQDHTKELLEVPAEMEIVELLTVGYPAGEPKTEKPRKDFDEVICWGKFE